jgi:hypothetical protein
MFDKNLVHAISGGKDLDCGSGRVEREKDGAASDLRYYPRQFLGVYAFRALLRTL